MGVKFIENILFNDDVDDCECSSCFSFSTNSSTMNATTNQQTLNANFKQSHQQQQPNHQHRNILFASKDLVGNSKEFRIENNKCNLRIIGNGNRIRIAHNYGSVQIIGNSTRLKITKNSGHIKYTGNEGRIRLGSESTQQTVDYIGCNGLLKVVDSTELNKSPKYTKNNKETCTTTSGIAATPIINNDKVNNNSKYNIKQINLTGNAPMGTSPNSAAAASLQQRIKSASFDDLDRQYDDLQHFDRFLQHDGWQYFTKASLPNLKENLNVPCKCKCKCKKNPNKSFINNLSEINNCLNSNRPESRGRSGDIVITNSVNVIIA